MQTFTVKITFINNGIDVIENCTKITVDKYINHTTVKFYHGDNDSYTFLDKRDIKYIEFI